jgi:hypothetical protein
MWRIFLCEFSCERRSICQDSLGTSIRKHATDKDTPFSAGTIDAHHEHDSVGGFRRSKSGLHPLLWILRRALDTRALDADSRSTDVGRLLTENRKQKTITITALVIVGLSFPTHW